MAGGQTFRLRWDGFRSRLSSVFDELRRSEELLDVTLCCDGGHTVQAHRVLLSASSPCLRQLLKIHPACQHPVFFLKDTSAEDLRAVIEFIYNGEVNVTQTQLASFIKTAEMLQIKGLSADSDTEEEQTPAPRRRRGSASVSPTPPLLGTRSRASAGAERSAGPPPSKRHRLSDATPEPPTNFAAASANAASAAGVQVAAATAVNPAATFTSSSAAAAAAAPAEYITPNSVGGAIGASTDPLAAGDTSKEIKTEQIDLSDDDDTGADLEDTLMRLSSYEGHDTSSPTHIALDAGPSTRDDLGHPPGLLTAAGTSGGAGASGSAASQGVVSSNARRAEGFGLVPLSQEQVEQLCDAVGRRERRDDSGGLVNRPPVLDKKILPGYLRVKMAQEIPLERSDWVTITNVIYEEFKDTNVSETGWYGKMAVSFVTQFPYILKHMEVHECVEMLRLRIGNKFKNQRKKQKRLAQRRAEAEAARRRISSSRGEVNPHGVISTQVEDTSHPITTSPRHAGTSHTPTLPRKIAPKPTTSSQPEATLLDLSSLPPYLPRRKRGIADIMRGVVTSSHDVTTPEDAPAITHDTPLILRRSLPRRAREARGYNEDGDEDFEEQERQSEDEEMRIEFVEPPPQEDPPEEDVPQEEPLQEEVSLEETKPSAVESSPEEEGSGNLVIADDPLAML